MQARDVYCDDDLINNNDTSIESANAKIKLAQCYIDGICGVDRDFDKAIELLQDENFVQYLREGLEHRRLEILANAFMQHQKTDVYDAYNKAYQYYLKAYNLWCDNPPDFDDETILKNRESLLLKSGYACFCCQLFNEPYDYSNCVKIYNMAIHEYGNNVNVMAEAKYWLGVIYEIEDSGYYNPQESETYYINSANLGYVKSQKALVDRYYKESNFTQLFYWLNRMYENTELDCDMRSDICRIYYEVYRYGKGVDKDLTKAKAFLKEAINCGDIDAKTELERLN